MYPTAATFRTRYYPSTYNAVVDGTPIFQRWIRERLTPGARLLDLGAGLGSDLHNYTDIAEVTAVDPDESVSLNKHSHSQIIADGARLPFPSACFDCCFSDFVFEHVNQPDEIVREVYRVLKPGGSFIFRTVNGAHYVALCSFFMPDGLRDAVLERTGRTAESFPTLYRFNGKRKIVRTLKRIGFEIEGIKCVEGPPDYLATFPRLYRLGVAYERLANYSERLSFMRANILVAARKATHPSSLS